nr:RNA-directed DNA polymerase, eukaryota [Tanacetum cinerariifolium]
KELFHHCKQYGHVVDSFIPNKRSKSGKRFGFVKFINVFNKERLVDNLCTVWIGRSKLQANLATFKRENKMGSGKEGRTENDVNIRQKFSTSNSAESIGTGKTFVSVVKKSSMAVETQSNPKIFLDDECMNKKDLSLALMGRVKDWALLAKLKKTLCIEGFNNLNISYLGELWVLLESESSKAEDFFSNNTGAGSWFSVLQQADDNFVPDGRLAWMEVDGIPFKLWTGKTFRRIASKWGELLDVEEDELNFHSKRICIFTKVRQIIHESFKVIFRGKVHWVRAIEVPGWTPEFSEEEEEEDLSVEGNFDGNHETQEVNNNFDESDKEKVLETEFEVPSGKKDSKSEDPFGIYSLLQKNKPNTESKVIEEDHRGIAEKVIEEKENGENLFVNNDIGNDSSNLGNKNGASTGSDQSDIPRSGGSILNLMEEVVKAGQTMGYNMEGCIKDINDIIESQGEFGGVWLKSGIDLLIVVVYAPQYAKEKRMMWEYLTHISNTWDGKIVMMGDFNEVRSKSDRFGSNYNVHNAEVFNSFIYKEGIEEVPLGGSAFTWCHKSASKMSRLDRFFVFENLLIACPNFSAITLERFLSDHRPILLRETSFDYGPIPFRFYRYWLDVDGFDKMVRDSWEAAPGNKNNVIRSFMGKLKLLKDRIHIWLSIHKANSRCETFILKEDLRVCDEKIDKGMGSMEVVQNRLGDENVKFFHGILNKKRSQSQIRGVMANGMWIEDPTKVKCKFLEHFQGRFDKPPQNHALIDIHFPNSLTNDHKVDLEQMVTKEEVKRAVWDCGVDKSSGPNGFSFCFYLYFWPMIEDDVFGVVEYFFIHGDMLKGCNSNFIALIPKIIDANLVKDFCPISLIGSLYKIIAKVLANRLVGVLSDLVNEVQSAFVADTQILDGLFILNEDFLDDVLDKFGFCAKWRTWIQSCLRSSRGSILINGSPTEEFQFFRGLKQGDPLSPFLFILVMESLHISFQRVVNAGLFNGINISSTVNLSHLFYANDAIFIGQWNELNIDTLIRVLECFFRASGLRINMCKSKIMGVNVEDAKVKSAANKLGCLFLKTPFYYLGTKVGENMSRKHAWNEIVEKVISCLSRWKLKTLSIGGRFTLLKSVLENRGLGVSSLYALNRGLMFKWLWRFYSQNHLLWTKVIKALYGEEGSLDKDGTFGGRTCWTSIIQEVKVLQDHGINVRDFIKLKLGNGDGSRFWIDKWYEGGVLKSLFPRVYALELNKNISVSSKLNAPSLDTSFRRIARSGIEETQFKSMAEIVKETSLEPRDDRKNGAVKPIKDQGITQLTMVVLHNLGLRHLDNNPRVPAQNGGFAFIVKNKGIDNDAAYPYEAEGATCNTKEESIHAAKITRQEDVPAEYDFKFYSSGV